MTFPRKVSGEWEMVRDSWSQIRAPQAGHVASTFLDPVGVATLNRVHFGD